MLLSILLVADDSNPYAAENLKQTLLSCLLPIPTWNDKYEIKSIVLSEQELMEASGTVPGINALMVKHGHVARCSGEYVWVLPSFVTFSGAEEAFASLANVLSLKVGAAALEANLNLATAKVELQSVALCLLPSAQNFDEFRYILLRQDLEECYAEGSDYLTMLTYLSLQESQNRNLLYARIPCQAFAMRGLSSPSFFNLCLGYFSGTRPWQRESLNLPRSLIYKMRSTAPQRRMPAGQIDSLRHFLFSSCSALEHFSASMFTEAVQRSIKDHSFDMAHDVLGNMATLAQSSPSSAQLMPHVTQLLCFLSQWKSSAADSIASNNVNPLRQQKSPINGLWWLGRELKDELNTLGKGRFQALINELRRSVEVVATKLA